MWPKSGRCPDEFAAFLVAFLGYGHFEVGFLLDDLLEASEVFPHVFTLSFELIFHEGFVPIGTELLTDHVEDQMGYHTPYHHDLISVILL